MDMKGEKVCWRDNCNRQTDLFLKLDGVKGRNLTDLLDQDHANGTIKVIRKLSNTFQSFCPGVGLTLATFPQEPPHTHILTLYTHTHMEQVPWLHVLQEDKEFRDFQVVIYDHCKSMRKCQCCVYVMFFTWITALTAKLPMCFDYLLFFQLCKFCQINRCIKAKPQWNKSNTVNPHVCNVGTREFLFLISRRLKKQLT